MWAWWVRFFQRFFFRKMAIALWLSLRVEKSLKFYATKVDLYSSFPSGKNRIYFRPYDVEYYPLIVSNVGAKDLLFVSV